MQFFARTQLLIIWNLEKVFYNIFKFDWGVTSFHLSLISRFFLWLWSSRLSDWDARIWSTFIGLWIRNVISKGKMQILTVRYVHKGNEIWGQPWLYQSLLWSSTLENTKSNRLLLKMECFRGYYEQFLQNKLFLKHDLGGFHLQLLVFPFVYQFNFRIGVLVNSSFAND